MSRPAPPSPGARILLVEDEAVIALHEAQILTKRGYDVRTAYSGEAALEMLRREGADLVLLDIDLGHGKMDGIRCAETVLRDMELPIVFLTSHAEKEIVEKVKGITRFGYVIKSSGEFVLVEAVEMALALFATQKGLEESRSMYRTIVRTTADGFWMTDREGTIRDVNDAYCALCGYSREELIGRNISFVEAREAPRDTELHMRKIIETGSDRFETVHRTRHGGLFDVEISATFLPASESLFVSFIREISGRKREVRELRRKIDALFQTGGDLGDLELADILDTAGIQSMMDHFYRISGIPIGILDTKGTILVATGWQEVCTHFHRRHPESLRNCLESDTVLASNPERGTFRTYKCKNNMWDIAAPIVFNGRHIGNLFVGQFFYADEEIDYELFRRQARRFGFDEERYIAALERVPRWSRNTVDSMMRFYSEYIDFLVGASCSTLQLARALGQRRQTEETLRVIIENIPFAVFAHDLDGNLLIVNRTSVTYTGWEREELLTMKVSDIDFDAPSRRDRERIWKELEHGSYRHLEVVHTRKDGSSYPAEVYLTAITLDGKEVILAMVQDISERKQLEEARGYLLKEMNHRIKNNLAIVASLISLKESASGQDSDLSDLRHQVEAIMIVHDKLYRSDDPGSINIREYLEDLLNTVFGSFTEGPVRIESSVADLALPSRTVVSIGLIVNEIAVNAIKHGFARGEEALFSISLEAEEGRLILELANSGNPFPETVSLDHPDTLGLRLLNALAGQIGGTLELRRSPVTTFRIAIPAAAAALPAGFQQA